MLVLADLRKNSNLCMIDVLLAQQKCPVEALKHVKNLHATVTCRVKFIITFFFKIAFE